MRISFDSNSWSVHESGHCRHPWGFDAVFEPPMPETKFIKAIGPFNAADTRENSNAMYCLTKQLEQLFCNELVVIWGTLTTQSGESSATLLGQQTNWLPNPIRRTQFLADNSAHPNEYFPEWDIDRNTKSVIHCSGISIQKSNGQLITVHDRSEWYPILSILDENSIVSVGKLLLERHCEGTPLRLPSRLISQRFSHSLLESKPRRRSILGSISLSSRP